MSITKGSAPNISEAFLEKITRFVQGNKSVYQTGDTIAECAYKQAQYDLLEFIVKHASTSPTY